MPIKEAFLQWHWKTFVSMPVGVSIKSKTSVIFVSETLADFISLQSFY